MIVLPTLALMFVVIGLPLYGMELQKLDVDGPIVEVIPIPLVPLIIGLWLFVILLLQAIMEIVLIIANGSTT
jgi:hypothetical protein